MLYQYTLILLLHIVDHYTAMRLLSAIVMAKTYKNNHNQPAIAPSELGGTIPSTISECSICIDVEQPTCVGDVVFDIKQALKIADDDPKAIMETAKEQLNCDTEKCVITKLASKLGKQKVDALIRNNFKVPGPRDNKLLSNVHIDDTLQQWSTYHKGFYAYNFNMLNYVKYSFRNGEVVESPDTLATVHMQQLYGKFNCAGCVINSDRYQGDGKHWMALFVDMRTTPMSVEFFNSSGNAPGPEWINWLIKTKGELESLGSKPVEIIKASNIRHQQSKTECGVYSLFYIYARLNGIPISVFKKIPIPDQLMFKFRQHLFIDPSLPTMKSFDWSRYIKLVKVQWERD